MKTAAVASVLALLASSALATSALTTSAWAAPKPLSDAQLSQIVAGTNFIVMGEISDTTTQGANPPDPLLVNSWGLAEAPAGGPLWVADNGSGMSTLYNFNTFAKIPLNVTIPGAGGATGAPTGTVFTSLNGTDFNVSGGGKTGHSLFLFDTENGTIAGWSPGVALGTAFTAVDQSMSGAAFKGLAISPDVGGGSGPGRGHGMGDQQGQNMGMGKTPGVTPTAQTLYAADFTQGKVEMFNGQFQQMGSFTDPSLPAGYSPFNVQVLNGKLYVTFALSSGGLDEVHGAGLGFVDVFTLSGQKLATLVSQGPLNAPWGLSIAPKSFGKLAGALLVGNFGDGTINAFDPNTGKFLGPVTSPGGAPVTIDGLWALRNGPDGSVIFSSGPDDENHGLVGVVLPANARASWAFQAHVMRGH
ncbi:MAG TPA: TIGR03118 family protein [Caulobacteraceae bacterium]|nr:TIGR03118 family protein [Caulobacteraceae bacterium]